MIETHVAGIPCQAAMTGGYYQRPDEGTWASDWDYYGGWFDVEFEIYDRKGYRAAWLDKKMTSADEARIIAELTTDAGEDDGSF